jgi:VCBS repeat protein/FG-GAP repeat protein
MKSKNRISLAGIYRFLAAGLLLSAAAPAASAQVQFSSPKNYPVGTAPVAVAVGDFNGDGKEDLAVANSGAGNVSILLGEGDGTFEAAANYSVGGTAGSPLFPTFVAVGDFNGDHKLDLAVANGGANTVSILLGNGDGTFQAPSQYHAGAFAGYVAVADFNGDGKLDLLTFNNQGTGTTGTNTISVLLGNGDGTFQQPLITSFQTNNLPMPSQSVALADFNGDGRLDVVAGNGRNTAEGGIGNLIILLGNGDGTFQPAVTQQVPFRPTSLAAGDFNDDGKIDLAVAAKPNVFEFATFVLLGTGDGRFNFAPNLQNPVHRGYGFGESSVAAADLNNRGELDLIGLIPNLGSPPSQARLTLGKGDGTFQDAVSIQLALVPNSLAVGDFNGDKLPDLVVINSDSTVSIILNQSAPPPDFSLSATPTSATVTPGGSATYKLTITPANGFNKTVGLGCTGAPILAGCFVSPGSVTLNGTSAATATVTFTTTAPAMTAPRGGIKMPPLGSVQLRHVWVSFLALLLLVLAASWARRGGDRRSPLQGRRRKLALALALATTLVWVACATHGPGTPPGTYTLTLTGDHFTLCEGAKAVCGFSHSTTVTVTVNP